MSVSTSNVVDSPIVITLFATSAAKSKEKKEKNMQIHKQSRQRNNMKVLKNTLSELQRPVIKPIATLQPVTNTEF